MAGPIDHGAWQRRAARAVSPQDADGGRDLVPGFSEPGAGSDLAAVRTRIEPHDDHFLVNGQKVWSSFAHIASYCILVGLSDADGRSTGT